MESKRKGIALLLAAALLVSLLPVSAFAGHADASAGKPAIMLGAELLEGAQKDKVYFGEYAQSNYTPADPPSEPQEDTIYTDEDGTGFCYLNNSGKYYKYEPVKWRVLSKEENSLFLLSDQNLDVKPFHPEKKSMSWLGCTLRSWLNGLGKDNNDASIDYSGEGKNFIGTAFSENEQTAIQQTATGDLTTDRIFLLSEEEAKDSTNGFTTDETRKSTNTAYAQGHRGANTFWWLRSPGEWRENADCVSQDGAITDFIVSNDFTTVRPAFRLNLDSVLFTSADKGGKSSETVGTLEPVASAAGNEEWTITLKDKTRGDFNVNEKEKTAASGETLELTYSGAQTGENEYVSAMLCDAEKNKVLYYGHLARNSASGTASITIPKELAAGVYTLNVFSQQWGGEAKTSFASAFQSVKLTVTEPMPKAEIDYAAETLTGLAEKAEYSLTSGEGPAETVTADENGRISIEESWLGKSLSIIKMGTDASLNSPAQPLILPERTGPPDVEATDESFSGEQDGTITGTTTGMEYRKQGGNWTDCPGTEVTRLEPGTYEVRIKAGASSFKSKEATVVIHQGKARTYTLKVTAPVFDPAVYGCPEPKAESIVIKSEGNSDTVITSVTLRGEDKDCFVLNRESGMTIHAGSTESAAYTIRPKAGLNAGTYTAVIAVSYFGATTEAEVSFTVEKAEPLADHFLFTPPENLTYDGEAKTASVRVKEEIFGMGAIGVEYENAAGERGDQAPVEVGTYQVIVHAEEGDNYLAASEITDPTWTFAVSKKPEETDNSSESGGGWQIYRPQPQVN